MSRKDYTSVARLISEQVEDCNPIFDGDVLAAVSEIARGMANIFAAHNSRFARERFYFACKLDPQGKPWPPTANDGIYLSTLSLHDEEAVARYLDSDNPEESLSLD